MAAQFGVHLWLQRNHSEYVWENILLITGVDVVFIHVRDPDLMTKWYKDTLDLDIEFQTSDHSWQEFKMESDGISTRFALDHIGDRPSIIERQKIIISFRVEDIHQIVHKLEQKGIAFFGEPTIASVGQSYFATLSDPEGNWIQLSQRRVD